LSSPHWFTGDKTPIHLARRWLHEGGQLADDWHGYRCGQSVGAGRASDGSRLLDRHCVACNRAIKEDRSGAYASVKREVLMRLYTRGLTRQQGVNSELEMMGDASSGGVLAREETREAAHDVHRYTTGCHRHCRP
jgi:hypothetical protein